MKKTISVAIIDDEKEILTMLERYFAKQPDFKVVCYQNPVSALASLSPQTDIVLLDIMMPQMSGLELLPKLQERYAGIKVIMMTAYSTLDKVLDAHRNGAVHYVMKPFESLSKLEKKVVEVANEA